MLGLRVICRANRCTVFKSRFARRSNSLLNFFGSANIASTITLFLLKVQAVHSRRSQDACLSSMNSAYSVSVFVISLGSSILSFGMLASMVGLEVGRQSGVPDGTLPLLTLGFLRGCRRKVVELNVTLDGLVWGISKCVGSIVEISINMCFQWCQPLKNTLPYRL